MLAEVQSPARVLTPCRHCGQRRTVRRRFSLCYACHKSKAIRAKYGVRHKCTPSRDFYGYAPLPKSPTTAQPGSEEKIAVMIARIEAGWQPHHPEDYRPARQSRGA